MAKSLMSVNNVPLTGLKRKWLWPHASPEGEFIKNSQIQERVEWGGEKTKFLAKCQPPKLEHKMPTHVGIWQNVQMTSWTIFFLKHCKGHTYINGISTTSSNVGCILPPHQIISHITKQNYILQLTSFLFFFFFSFRGLATRCGSAMLKPKGISDCVPKYLLLVTLWKE